MDDSGRNIEKADVSSELLQYYDDFTAFNEDCAFLCDSFASVVANSEFLEERSLRGLARHANWLKRRVGEFKEELDQIRKRHSRLSG